MHLSVIEAEVIRDAIAREKYRLVHSPIVDVNRFQALERVEEMIISANIPT